MAKVLQIELPNDVSEAGMHRLFEQVSASVRELARREDLVLMPGITQVRVGTLYTSL